MAFDYTNLYPDTSGNGGFTKTWNYTTVTDSIATCSAVGYFNKVATRLGIGDNIVVAQVDAFDKARTALIDKAVLFVMGISNGVVTTNVFKNGLENVPNVDTTNSANINFLQSGTGAVTRTIQAKARDIVSITDFGAIGDGNVANASVNTAALNAALATGKCAFIPYTSSGYNFGTNTITLGNGACIQGENYVKLLSQSTSYFFGITGFANWKTISGVTFDMTGAGTSSTALRMRTSGGVVAFVDIHDARGQNLYEFIGDEGTNYTYELFARNVYTYLTLGRQVYLRYTAGFADFRDFQIDFTANPTIVSYEGARFEGFSGLYLSRFNVYGRGNGTPAVNTGVTAIVINGTASGSAAVYLDQVFADTTIGDGILINNANYVFADKLESNHNLNNGIVLSNLVQGQFTNTVGNGASGLTGFGANAQGLTITSSTNINMANVWASGNSGFGVTINGTSSGVSIANAVGGGNNVGDIFFGNTAANNTISGSGTPSVTNSSSGANNKFVSGANIPLLNAANTWSGTNAFGTISTQTPATKTANYTQTATDGSLIFNGAGSLTITLLAASTVPGQWLTIKTVAAQTVVSASANVVPLAGGAAGTAIVAATAGKWAVLQSDGTNWIIMAGN